MAETTSTKHYRMNTPKGQVNHAFDGEGKAAAEKVAEKHGIKPGRLARWFREWSGDAVAPRRPAVKPKLATKGPKPKSQAASKAKNPTKPKAPTKPKKIASLAPEA